MRCNVDDIKWSYVLLEADTGRRSLHEKPQAVRNEGDLWTDGQCSGAQMGGHVLWCYQKGNDDLWCIFMQPRLEQEREIKYCFTGRDVLQYWIGHGLCLGPEPWPCFLCPHDDQFSVEAPVDALADQMPLVIAFSPLWLVVLQRANSEE